MTSHSAPATTLAASMATPLTRLNMPKAVPRNSAGAVSATSADEQPLRQTHMQAPQRHAGHNAGHVSGKGKNEIGEDQNREAGGQQAVAAKPVGQRAGRPG